MNGTSASDYGLHDLGVTSADMERRNLRGQQQSDAMSLDEPRGPTTAPLEVKEMPPALSKTLENIVGQLDVLTQVKPIRLNFFNSS